MYLEQHSFFLHSMIYHIFRLVSKDIYYIIPKLHLPQSLFLLPFSWFLGFTFLDSFILLKNEFMYYVYLFIYCVFRKLIKLFLTNTEFVKIKIFISQIWTLFFLITTFLSYLQTLSNSWYCFSAILVWYFNSLPNGE